MKDYKILLVNPPHQNGIRFTREGRCNESSNTSWRTIWPPYSLASIGGILEKVDFKIKLNDCAASGININRFLNMVKEYTPGLIIMNTATPSIESDVEIAKLLKRKLPQSKIALFGIHVSVFSEEILKMGIDFIIRGEPEITARDLAIALYKNKDFNGIKGLSWRKNNKTAHNADREFIEDLDLLPKPAWHLVDTTKYRFFILGKPYLIISPARGCIHRCIFCWAGQYYGYRRRNHSVEYVIEEILECQSSFKINNFLLWTEDFAGDREWVNEFSDSIIRRSIKIRWMCTGRVDNVDRGLLLKMKKAGCCMISYGVESGNQHILNAAKKNITMNQIREAIFFTEKAGIATVANCMFGLPGETRMTIYNTIKFINELKPTIAQFYCTVPRPATEFYRLAKANNWIKTASWSDYNLERSIIETDDLTSGEIVKLRRRAVFNFYFRPKTIVNLFKLYMRFNIT